MRRTSSPHGRRPDVPRAQGVGHCDAAALSVECGFQHLRVADVAPGHLKGIVGSKFEVAAADRV